MAILNLVFPLNLIFWWPRENSTMLLPFRSTSSVGCNGVQEFKFALISLSPRILPGMLTLQRTTTLPSSLTYLASLDGADFLVANVKRLHDLIGLNSWRAYLCNDPVGLFSEARFWSMRPLNTWAADVRLTVSARMSGFPMRSQVLGHVVLICWLRG